MIDEAGSPGVQIKDALKQAYSTLHKIQNKDWERRQEFLNNLAEKYASENKIPKELAIRELMHHEELRELFRHIRIKMKGMRTPQLSEIWTTDEEQENTLLQVVERSRSTFYKEIGHSYVRLQILHLQRVSLQTI